LSQKELAAWSLENGLSQVQTLLLACLTDNIQHMFFLASELSIEKKKYTRQVECASYFTNTYFGCYQFHRPSMEICN